MGDTAPDVLTEIRGDWNCVKIKKLWTEFANFTYEIKVGFINIVDRLFIFRFSNIDQNLQNMKFYQNSKVWH